MKPVTARRWLGKEGNVWRVSHILQEE